MSSEARLVLVRHGHTASNGAGLSVPMSGWTDDPLSAEGFEDARRAALHLALGGPAVRVYTSPLRRARTTAELIAEACAVQVSVDEDLREIACGDADGLPIEEVRRRYPEHWRRNLEQSDPEFRWPGGESYRELRERSLRSMTRLASEHPGERVIVVTHAGVICQVMGFIHGSSAARWEAFRPRNGSITEIRVASSGWSVARFDELPSPAAAGSGSAEKDSRSAA